MNFQVLFEPLFLPLVVEDRGSIWTCSVHSGLLKKNNNNNNNAMESPIFGFGWPAPRRSTVLSSQRGFEFPKRSHALLSCFAQEIG